VVDGGLDVMDGFILSHLFNPNFIIFLFYLFVLVTIIAQPYNKMQSEVDSTVHYYTSYEAAFNALKEEYIDDECSLLSEESDESSIASLGDGTISNINSFVGTLSDDEDISIDTYESLSDGDDARGDCSSNASRSTQYTFFTLLSTIDEDGESQYESICTVSRRPLLMRDDVGSSLKRMLSHAQAQRCTSPLEQEVTYSDADNCSSQRSFPEWALYDCDSSTSTTGRSSTYFSCYNSPALEFEEFCFEHMQRKLGFNLARIVLEKSLHLPY
jgi:hypothetical protein